MKAYLKASLAVFGLVLAALVMMILASQPSHAAGPWYVAPGGDDGNDCLSPGTACATINGALNRPGFVLSDTILVATGTYTGTGDEVVLLDKDVILSGGWDASFTTQSDSSTIDGQGSRRGITVNSGVTATVERFTVQSSGNSGAGGGIYNQGTLTLNNSTISGNASQHSGGGIYSEEGTVILNNSTVRRNSSGSYGGGIYNGYGNLTLNHSTVSENTVNGEGGGVYNNYGTMTLNNSIVSGNRANSRGGGIRNYLSNLTLHNSAISGNTSGYEGGGIHNHSSVLTLNDSTISGNKARED